MLATAQAGSQPGGRHPPSPRWLACSARALRAQRRPLAAAPALLA